MTILHILFNILLISTCASSLVIRVNKLVDEEVNTTHCLNTQQCTLRSALTYCTTEFTSSNMCQVVLPDNKVILMNSSFGTIGGSVASGVTQLETVLVEGRGSSVHLGESDVVDEEVGFVHLVGDSNRKLNFMFKNISFLGFTGSVLQLDNVNIVVEDSSFIDNKAEYGKEFIDYYYFIVVLLFLFVIGGAVYLHRSSHSNITRSIFRKNRSSRNGGAIYCQNDVDYLTISDCLFEENVAVEEGGSVYLYEENYYFTILNSNFTDNIAGMNGGVLFLKEYNEYCTLSQCQFLNNTAVAGQGGAVEVNEKSHHFLVTFSHFEYNSARVGSGGAIMIEVSSFDIQIESSTFVKNYAGISGGGCIFFSEINDVLLTQNTFDGNIAGSSGGALYFFISNSDVTISDNTFVNNVAYSGDTVTMKNGQNFALGGGAIFIDVNNADFEISRCLMQNNSALFASGGGCFINTNNRDILISECDQNNNFAYRAGGSMYIGSGNYDLIVSDSVVVNNTADLIGGGAFMLLAYNSVSIINTTLSYNVAAVGGGVLCFLNNFYFKMENCVMRSNIATLRGGAINVGILHQVVAIIDTDFIDNWAQEGGGISIEEWSAVTIKSSRFMENGALSLNLAQSTSSDINEAFGGAIFCTSDNLYIESSSFDGNTGDEGGAIHVSGNHVTIKESTFNNNFAKVTGGAAHLSKCNDVIISDCEMSGNSNVAAYFSLAVYVTIEKSTFVQSSGVNGGAIVADASENFKISQSYFSGNNVTEKGGALYFYASSNIAVENSTLIHNTASSGGGSYIELSNVVTFLYNILEKNTANLTNGGGMLIKTSSASVRFNKFIRNSAALGGGGGLFWVYSGGSMQEPSFISTNHFNWNSALYGNDKATDAVRMVYGDTNGTQDYIGNTKEINAWADESVTVVPMNTYNEDMLWPIRLVDKYDSKVANQDGVLSASAWSSGGQSDCGEEQPYLTGRTMAPIENGFGNLEFSTFCNPNGYTRVVFTTDISTLPDLHIELQFRNCYRGEYYSNGACIQCPNGTYSLSEHTEDELITSCLTCPSHANCYSDAIILDPGYWRLSQDVVEIFSCPLDGSCAGGEDAGSDTCNSGYTGIMCGVCDKDFYYPSLKAVCQACSNGDMQVGLVIVVVIVSLIVIGLFIYCFGGRICQEFDSQTGMAFITKRWKKSQLSFVEKKKQYLETESTARKYQNKLKQLITFFQILTAFPSILSTTFPSIYYQLTSWINVINMGSILKDLGFVCSFDDLDYISTLVAATLGPIFVSLALYVVQQLHCHVVLNRYSPAFREIANIQGRIEVLKATYQYVFLFFTYLILPGVSTVLFGMLKPCTDVDPDDLEGGNQVYLEADLSIRCSGSRYHFGVTWAVIFCFVYPLGIPLYYFYLLRNSRDLILRRADIDVKRLDEAGLKELERIGTKLSSIKFLFQEYQPNFWYFEIIETYRKLFLTSVLSVISPGSTKQLVFGNLFVVFCLVLYVCVEPFDDIELSTTSSICQLQVWYILFLSIIIKEEVHISQSFIEVSVAFAILFILVYESFLCVIEFCPLPKRVQAFIDSIIVSKTYETESQKLMNKRKSFIKSDDVEASLESAIRVVSNTNKKNRKRLKEGSTESESVQYLKICSDEIMQQLALVDKLQTELYKYRDYVRGRIMSLEEEDDDDSNSTNDGDNRHVKSALQRSFVNNPHSSYEYTRGNLYHQESAEEEGDDHLEMVKVDDEGMEMSAI